MLTTFRRTSLCPAGRIPSTEMDDTAGARKRRVRLHPIQCGYVRRTHDFYRDNCFQSASSLRY